MPKPNTSQQPLPVESLRRIVEMYLDKENEDYLLQLEQDETEAVNTHIYADLLNIQIWLDGAPAKPTPSPDPIATALVRRFPWLRLDDTEDISGADTIQELCDWYEQLTAD